MAGHRSMSLRLLPEDALQAMLAEDLDSASRIVGHDLPAFFLHEKWLWEIRLKQIRRSPGDAPWLVRAAVLEPKGVVVGHAGFHGPPDASSTVEIGYTVVPDHRGRGYSHLVLARLLHEAASTQKVTTVRATIGPENAASLAVVTAAGFTHVGEQWDAVDGTELFSNGTSTIATTTPRNDSACCPRINSTCAANTTGEIADLGEERSPVSLDAANVCCPGRPVSRTSCGHGRGSSAGAAAPSRKPIP